MGYTFHIVESISTETIATVSNSSFWQNIPAAAYVLLGVIISGIFTIFSDRRNITNSRLLKELENENSRLLKELENENSRETQGLEITYREKSQELKEKSDRALRLLDDRLKVFSDFYNNYSEVLLSGTNIERHKRIEVLRKDVYKVRLLAPSVKDNLDSLDDKLMNFSNFYLEIINKEKTFSKTEKDDKITGFIGEISPLTDKIFDTLVNNL